MQELRLVAVSEDGTYVVLAQPGRASRFALPNDERLRAVARGQFSRLAQYEIEVENPLRPKEIQARIRSGETAEQIADAAGVPIERVRWFEGPVLAERAYIAQQAQAASVRCPGDSGPGPRLGEIVSERLHVLGADPDEARWDSRKRGDGSWLVELASQTGMERLTAAWVFDPRRRHAIPDDEEAARLSLPEDALQAAGLAVQSAAGHGGGTVTPFTPRSQLSPPRSDERESGLAPHGAFEPVSQRASELASHGASELASRPGSEPATRSAARPMSHSARTGAHDVEGDARERGSHSAAPQDPQTSASGTAQLRAPGRSVRPGQATAREDGAEQQPHVPPAPASHLQPRETPRSPAAAAVAPAAAAEVPQAAEAQREAPQSRNRPARKAAGGRSRRSSVPTWDEIMFGSSRRQD